MTPPINKIRIHADDIGLCRGVNESILKSIDDGCVTSVSLITNGHDYEYAVGELRKRPNVNIAIHLNFLEGQSLAKVYSREGFSDDNGNLQAGFLGTLLKSFLSRSKTKKEMREVFFKEAEAQVLKAITSFGSERKLGLDSHQYYHMIPFIFDIGLELHQKYNLSYIRTTNEPFLLKGISEFFNSLKNLNFIKLIVLRILHYLAVKKVKDREVHTNSYYLGILASGKMRTEHLENFLARFQNNLGEVEFVTHPGRCHEEEQEIWKNRPELLKFVQSKDRDFEKQEVCSDELRKLLETGIGNN